MLENDYARVIANCFFYYRFSNEEVFPGWSWLCYLRPSTKNKKNPFFFQLGEKEWYFLADLKVGVMWYPLVSLGALSMKLPPS